MARILIITWDGGGVVPPALGIGAELHRRGHDVRVLGHAAQYAAVHEAGLGFAAYAVAQALLVFALAGIMAVAARRGWFAPDAPPGMTRRGWLRSLASGSGFLLSLPLFPLIGSWAFAVWAVGPVVVGRLLPHR